MKLLIPVALLVTAGVGAVAVIGLRSSTDSEASEFRPPVLPSRTAVSPPPILEPPSLPDGAATLRPIRFTVTTMWSGAQGRRRTSQRVTRTADRIHLLLEGAEKEWLLERNPLDSKRVSGYLVDHRSRQILAHQESDLRNEQQLRGWADALTMRFDPVELSRLRRTNQTAVTFGTASTRYLAQDRSKEGVIDVWWSDALLLPLRLQVRHRGVIATSAIGPIEDVPRPETLAVLAQPRTRFPGYEVLDVSDSRERRH